MSGRGRKVESVFGNCKTSYKENFEVQVINTGNAKTGYVKLERQVEKSDMKLEEIKLESSSRIFARFFPNSLASFHLKQKLSNFRLSNLSFSNFSFFSTALSNYTNPAKTSGPFSETSDIGPLNPGVFK